MSIPHKRTLSEQPCQTLVLPKEGTAAGCYWISYWSGVLRIVITENLFDGRYHAT